MNFKKIFNNFNNLFNEPFFTDEFLVESYSSIRKYVDLEGTTEYYKNGKLHCEFGPAVIKKDGTKEYWLNGRQVTEADIEKLKDSQVREYSVKMTKSEKEKVEKLLNRKI